MSCNHNCGIDHTTEEGTVYVSGEEPPPEPPETPNGLEASAGDSEINLSWNPSFGADEYLIYREEGSSGTTGGGNCADLNTIPTLLLDKVEVLTGGASSVYGSDADHSCEWITNEDLVSDGIAKKARSNNALSNTRLAQYGIKMRPVNEALLDTIKKYAEAKRTERN